MKLITTRKEGEGYRIECYGRVLLQREHLRERFTFDVNGIGLYSVSTEGPTFLCMETYLLHDTERNVIARFEHPAVVRPSYIGQLEYEGNRFKFKGKDNPVVAFGRFKLAMEELNLLFDIQWNFWATEIHSDLDPTDPQLVAVAVLLQVFLIRNWNRFE